MHLRLLIAFIFAGFVVSDAFTQDKSQPTVDELVAKNIEAKGGTSALHGLTTLRLSGKMLVQGGQIQLAYLQIKRRPEDVRTEASRHSLDAEIPNECRPMMPKRSWKTRRWTGHWLIGRRKETRSNILGQRTSTGRQPTS